jgi:hypothetical protein
MRKSHSVLLSLGILFWFAAGSAHAATLYLPRQFQPSEMPLVGAAFVNPGSAAVSATFRFISSSGAILATSQRTIGARGQVSFTLSQLFPQAAGAGYMSVTVDSDLVTGFWLGGNFVTSTDGGPLVSSVDAWAYPDFTYLLNTSEISLINTGAASAFGILNLTDTNGAIVASVPFQIPSQGLIQRTVASLFPNQAGTFDTVPYWISGESSAADALLIGTTVTPTGGDNIVTNATSLYYSTLTFPQIVDGLVGGTVYRTVLTIVNPRENGKKITITLNTAAGPAVS